MSNFQIILIVFGSSAFIVIILIVIFKWMSIGLFSCFKKSKISIYQHEQDDQCMNENNETNQSLEPLYFINKSISSIWKNLSINTTETNDFIDISIKNLNNESLISHQKPILKYTTPIKCEIDSISKLLFDENSDLDSNNCKLEIEINYNAFEEYLQVKIIQFKDVVDLFQKKFNDTFELFDIYFIISLNENFSEKFKSQSMRLKNKIDFDQEFKWYVEDASLMFIQVNIIFYLININTHVETAFKQSSFKIGQVYLYHPTRTWLSVQDIDQKLAYMGEILVSLTYLPTAERLTVVIIEARNLQFEKCSIFGDSFVTISLFKKNECFEYESECFRTSVRECDPNPQFNEASIFKVSTKDFDDLILKISVYEILKNNTEIKIGSVLIGPSHNNNSNSHWKHMLKQVRHQVTMWHQIANI